MRTLENCVATYNDGNGIEIWIGTVVRNCNSSRNGEGEKGSGIVATSGENLIVGNMLDLNKEYGISAGSGNLVIKNSATQNGVTNYNIGSAQYGPIVPAAAGAITNTNPWANFEY